MPRNGDPELRELPAPLVQRLPLGFRRIFVKELLPPDVEEELMVTNAKYRSKEGPHGTDKPTSKIVARGRRGRPFSEGLEPLTDAKPEMGGIIADQVPESGSAPCGEESRMTRFDLDRLGGYHLRLFADCIPVQGTAWSAIYDLTRGDIIRFPTEYYWLLKHLTRGKLKDRLEPFAEPSQRARVAEFVEYLFDNELAHTTQSPEALPAIAESWEAPGTLQNAVIDVDRVMHDFAAVFGQLDELGCRVVQIRGFSGLLGLAELEQIVPLARHRSIESLELIIRYEAERNDRDYVRFVRHHPMVVQMVVHSAPNDRDVASPDDDGLPDSLRSHIRFVTQRIDSEQHCGVITLDMLSAPSAATFFENKLFNGCLNRKVGIDADGRIKNCPSMAASFGNVRDTRLADVVRQDRFQAQWSVTKDGIATCRGCELRYACSDCRAFVEDPQNGDSKPLKCGYDPALGAWTDGIETG